MRIHCTQTSFHDVRVLDARFFSYELHRKVKTPTSGAPLPAAHRATTKHTMGMFNNLMSKIFGHATTATSPASPTPGPATASGSAGAAGPATAGGAAGTSGPSMTVASATGAGPATGSGLGGAGPATATGAPASVDVTAILDGLAAKNSEKLDWKKSIVDLLKLVGLDSSLSARKELATELHYTGDQGDSAKMNVWLHQEVIKKLAANGGKVPADLLD